MIQFNVLTEQHVDETAALIAETFTKGEPMIKLLHINYQDFYDFAYLFCERTVSDGLSAVAIDTETNKVVGCLICEDMGCPPPEGVDKVSPTIVPALALLEELDHIYTSKHTIEKGQVYHMFLGSVYPEYSNRNMLYNLGEFVEKIARSKNFKQILLEVTGKASQKVFLNKLNYKLEAQIRYKDFVYENKNVFSGIETAEYCCLASKNL